MCRYHGNRGNDNIFWYNMRSFIQAHYPTNFEVHSLSTLENPNFKFSLPLSMIYLMKHWNVNLAFHSYSLRLAELQINHLLEKHLNNLSLLLNHLSV